MMACSTVVIAAHETPRGERRYTAKLVDHADYMLSDADDVPAFTKVEAEFLSEHGVPWFTSLSRAKQLATLLADDAREQGALENQEPYKIEIAEDQRTIYRMSRKGNRIYDCWYA
jgi:hypothetical protein